MLEETPIPRAINKGELICKMVARYPSIDYSTIQLISHIQAIGKSLSFMINEDLAEHGLTEGRLYVLAYLLSEELSNNDDPSPSQIADHVGVTRGTVTGLLDGLERDGFLERFHDVRDRRGLTIRMTDKSRAFLDSFLPNITSRLSREIALTETEKTDLIQSLARIEEAIGHIAPKLIETT